MNKTGPFSLFQSFRQFIFEVGKCKTLTFDIIPRPHKSSQPLSILKQNNCVAFVVKVKRRYCCIKLKLILVFVISIVLI